MKIYGTQDCINCIEAKAELEDLGIDFEFHDVGEILNLKAFLNYRDSLDIYVTVKEMGKAGVPTFVLDDGTVTLDFEVVKSYFGA